MSLAELGTTTSMSADGVDTGGLVVGAVVDGNVSSTFFGFCVVDMYSNSLCRNWSTSSENTENVNFIEHDKSWETKNQEPTVEIL